MIQGIGIDIVSVVRMEENLSRHGKRFPEKILSDSELGEYESSSIPAHFLAKRFAAKEALVKALGTGFRDGIFLKHISVTHDSDGCPKLLFIGKLREVIQSRMISSYLSLSDEKDYACAVVVLESGS